MKFYDKGFITKYDDNIHLQIFNAGQMVLNLKIYKDEVCQGTFECISSKEFNSKYFHTSYKDDFLYNLLSNVENGDFKNNIPRNNKIYFKDKKNKILIKVNLTDNEFSRLLEQIISPNVFKSAKILREINNYKNDAGNGYKKIETFEKHKKGLSQQLFVSSED